MDNLGTDNVFMVYINNYSTGSNDITDSNAVIRFYKPNGGGTQTIFMPTETPRSERYFVVACYVSATGLSVIYPVLQFTNSDPGTDFSYCAAVL